MTQLFNTLFVTEPDISLHLEGRAIRARHGDGRTDLIPLLQIEKIIVFSNRPVSRGLAAYCAENGIGLSILSERGRFLYRIQGPTRGSVLLRKRQYTLTESEHLCLAKDLLQGKLDQSLQLLRDFRDNHPNFPGLKEAAASLKQSAAEIAGADCADRLRGIEGSAARVWFSAFGSMVLSDQPELRFAERSRRPPKDRCNALLSLSYTLLCQDCIAALEAVGLDPYVGLLHGDRPGKPSLALDLMEEFRPIADRHVLRMINLRIITPDGFTQGEDGGYFLTGEGRRAFLREWNRMRKQEVREEPLARSIPRGLSVHLEAQRLSRILRGEEAFPGIGGQVE